jgi:dolichol-phosphate mannosyltransferase
VQLFDSRGERRLFALACLPGAWLCATMPVFAQEAYYWTYAQHPDLGYYDHPPMVGWLIWIGVTLFGDGAFAIRFCTMLCGIATMALGLAMLRQFRANDAARKTWIVASSCAPALLQTRFLANPDPALCMFFLGTMLCLWKARDGALRWWLGAGLCAGLALLSKYTATFLGLGGAILLLLDPSLRRQLLRPGPWLGVVVAVLAFWPVVQWNLDNDFESFRFQTSRRFSRAEFHVDWLFEFLGQQLAMANPALAAAIPASLLWLLRRARARDVRALWICAFALPMPLFFLGNAALMHVKPNWIAPAYLPLLLGLAMWHSESGFKDRNPRLARFGRRAMLAVVPLLALAPLLQAVPQHRGSSWSGWEEIAASVENWRSKVEAEDPSRDNVFVFGSDYKDAAQLTRAMRRNATAASASSSPEALAQNVFGEPALQFDHWDAPVNHIGHSAVFVLPRAGERKQIIDRVAQRFASCELVEHVEPRRLGIAVMSADVYVCRDYKGPR